MDQVFAEKQKETILKQIEALQKTAKDTSYDEIGSAGEDNAAEFEEFEEAVALSNSARQELADLKLALEKIENGTYGICEECQENIESGRLEAFPASRFCATHAK